MLPLVLACGAAAAAAEPIRMEQLGSTVKALVWRPSRSESVLPEMDPDLGLAERLLARENFGVAFAGGGGRGMALGHGSFRALWEANLSSRIRYLSVTSGSVPFGVTLYYQTQDSLEAFLGKSLPPEELTPELLTSGAAAGTQITRLRWPIAQYPSSVKADAKERSAPGNMEEGSPQHRRATEQEWKLPQGLLDKAENCLQDLCTCLAQKLLPDLSLHDTWILLTAYAQLHPFGLASPRTTHAHALRAEEVRKEMGGATVFSSQDLKHDLPFLLSQSAVLAPFTGRHNESLVAWPLEVTPFYAGVPGAYTKGGLGDALVEPFAWSSQPSDPAPDGPVGPMRLHRERFFLSPGDLAEWAGTATCYAADFQVRTAKLPPECVVEVMEKVFPQAQLWSPLRTDKQGVPVASSASVGDAGVYDDLGHIPLLRRRVPKMVIYDSSAIQDNRTGTVKENLYEMVYTLAAFGQPNAKVPGLPANPPGSPNPGMADNFLTVFEPSEFPKFWAKVESLHNQGLPCIVRDNFTVVENTHFGIAGGWQVEIVWIIALPILEWRSRLPKATAEKLPSYFPNLVSSEAKNRLYLGALSQYGSWITAQALPEIRSLLAHP